MKKNGFAVPVILAIIFGISTAGLTSYVVYDKATSSNEAVSNEKTNDNEMQGEQSNDQKNSETKENEMQTNENASSSSIPVDDLFAYQIGNGFYYMLKVENGVLYADFRENVSFDSAFDSQKDSGYGTAPKYVKVLDNVKRIKAFHTRSDILISFYAVLNDGSVKQITNEGGKLHVIDVNLLNNYKIDDLIKVTGGAKENGAHIEFNCKLLDGTTKVIKS